MLSSREETARLLYLNQVLQGLLVGGLGEEMAELGVEFSLVVLRISLDFIGNVLQGGKVGGGVAVAERVIGDDFQAAAEECLEFGVHRYGFGVAANL